VKSPALLLDTLSYITSTLSTLGFTAQLAPLFCLARFVASTLVSPSLPDLQALWQRRTAAWLATANMPGLAASHLAAAGSLVLNEALVKEYRQEVSVREAHKKRSEASGRPWGTLLSLVVSTSVSVCYLC
jgi:hypothetical protein